MANPEHVAILGQGVARWNEWRKDKDGHSLDLSSADLRNRDLTGADLRTVNLSNAVLRGAKLGKGSLLWNANLSGADLYDAKLRGADLQDVNFSGADLFQAGLRECNLQGADLSAAKGGLLSKQLAGSDLTSTKLPEPLAKLYDGLTSVKEISGSAQKLFLALLAGCLYSWLTIAQTTDVELVTNRATTPLPIIQAAIPIVGFYVVTPLILLCLYFYFHFYLQKLWEELGSLPAVFTDGRLLHNRTDPWLLNDLVRSHFLKLKDDRPFLSYFQAWVSVLLAWWLVPITLFLFWSRFLRRHDLLWTTVHALLLALALYSAVRLYRIAGETLRGDERTVFRWKELFKRRSTYLRIAFATVLGALLIAISLGAIFGEPRYTRYNYPSGMQCIRENSRLPLTWVACAMNSLKYSPFLHLTNADVSTKPPNWTGKKADDLDLVKGANLENSDLRNAEADGAFLAKANLRLSDMEAVHLDGADLRQARMNGANLDNAWLAGASLQGATLHYAHLKSAFLNNASLARAELQGANMEGVFLLGAELTGADLTDANIKYGLLPDANLQGADLALADLQHSDFTRANLERADLRGADLTGARLGSANIKYADLRHALYDPGPAISSQPITSLTKGLTLEMILEAINWQLAFFDPDMLKQLGLPPGHNEKLEQQMKAEQQAKAAAATPADAKPNPPADRTR